MHILEVLPIAKGIPFEVLPYVSIRPAAIGQAVEVPLGTRTIRGIVVGISDARNHKAAIKGASFTIRRVTNILDEAVDARLLAALTRFADESCVSLPDLLSLLYGKGNIPHIETPHESDLPKTKQEHNAVQVGYKERIGWYRTSIRQAFARRESVHVFCPTIHECETIAAALSLGIETSTFVLHSKKTDRIQKKTLKELSERTDPFVLVSTPGFVTFEHPTIRIMIIERDSSPLYRRMHRPLLDMRNLIETIAEARGMGCVRGDTILDLETVARAKSRSLVPALPLRSHLEHTATLHFLASEPLIQTGISEELASILEKAKGKQKRVCIITTRRGYAPLTRCSDCGYILRCPTCEHVLVLHEKKSGSLAHRTYICHTCGGHHDVNDRCPSCEGWTLRPTGAGSEHLRNAVTNWGVVDVSEYDEDTEDTKALEKSMKSWYDKPGTILVGTPRLVTYFDAYPPDVTVIVSFDHLLGTLSYRAHERALGLGVQIMEHTTAAVFLSTHVPDHPVIASLRDASFTALIETELEERRLYHLPPASHLLKVVLSGNQAFLPDVTRLLDNTLAGMTHDILRFKNPHPGEVTLIVLLTFESAQEVAQFYRHGFPREELAEFRYRVTFHTNPDRLLDPS